MNKNLERFGWNKYFQDQLDRLQTDLIPARIVRHFGVLYHLQTSKKEITGKIGGSLGRNSINKSSLPVIGDWVLVDSKGEDLVLIKKVLERSSKFSRQSSGEKNEQEQVVVANLDLVFIVTGLDENYSLRRIERFLVLAKEGGVKPVLIFNKADLSKDIDAIREEVVELAPGIPQVYLSVVDNTGFDELKKYVNEGQTISFIGSTGVGKSSIINKLLGEERLKTQEVRKGSIGRHTTTHKELFLLPSGAMVIDTPGMREVGMWRSSGKEVKQAKIGKNSFEDISEFAKKCKFNDCQHDTEPGCAVKEALENDLIDPAHFESYRKISKEMAYIQAKNENPKRSNTKKRWKQISKENKRLKVKYD